MKYNIRNLPGPGFLTYQLTKDEMDFVWKRISEVTDLAKNPKLYNDKLAGNISKSFELGLDNIDIISNIVFTLAKEYEKQFSLPYEKHSSGDKHYNFNEWWVNYQYQTEFNPTHSHTGIYSWVIWMKIPTEFEDQSKLPIAANSNAKNKISNFTFTYTDTLGVVVDYAMKMNKDKEGMMAFFPASLKHSVYPFFNSDEPRIYVAGNIAMYTSPSK